MGTGANGRVSPGRVVVIFVGLLAVWLAFQFQPRRKEPPPAMAPVKAESRVRAAGLADNPDWDGLPEMFAVWADKIEWNDDKTYFAYWHPGSRTYAYFFEAIRHEGGQRFREIPSQWLSDEGYQAEDGDDPAQVARRDAETSTHPFVFFSRLTTATPNPSFKVLTPPGETATPVIPVELKPPPLVIPPSPKTDPR